jgi:tetratricopeptide (TPR) repeat protein
MAATRLELWRQPVTFTVVMRINIVNLKHTVAALGCTLLLCGAATAQEAPAELLEELRTAPEGEYARVQRQIEQEWSKSGSATMDLLLKRGREALQNDNIPLAIEHLTALTDHAPQFAEGYHARAQAYFNAGLYGPALDDLEITLALNPTQYNAIFGLATMVQEFGNSRQAAELYRRVLEINPHHENAQKALDALQRDGIGRRL